MDGVIGIDDNQDWKGEGGVVATWLSITVMAPGVGGFTAFHDARAGALSHGCYGWKAGRARQLGLFISGARNAGQVAHSGTFGLRRYQDTTHQVDLRAAIAPRSERVTGHDKVGVSRTPGDGVTLPLSIIFPVQLHTILRHFPVKLGFRCLGSSSFEAVEGAYSTPEKYTESDNTGIIPEAVVFNSDGFLDIEYDGCRVQVLRLLDWLTSDMGAKPRFLTASRVEGIRNHPEETCWFQPHQGHHSLQTLSFLGGGELDVESHAVGVGYTRMAGRT
ncbi:hypothetical protein An14g04380 [Aspergillus niger]|uniref:Uncharacterized protein n=2 Tax=Aspergillus niger TaxID=5061 RepID=A2R3I2_ASPNC|nr:hypothetical protein An14g04380 [Aspergillus niger]CAK48530.1 hypothetical protein An14g04380 [Aspergillus niger]